MALGCTVGGREYGFLAGMENVTLGSQYALEYLQFLLRLLWVSLEGGSGTGPFVDRVNRFTELDFCRV